MLTIGENEPLARAVTETIKKGDVEALKRLLRENPELGSASVGTRTLLHLATDWPGHFPNGAAVVAVLIEAGADPNAPAMGRFPETPLHWAASSDDVEVIDALLDHRANIEAPGASIAGGTPLDDAVGYGQWRAARRLVERGAKVYKLWQAAALGMMPLIEGYFEGHDKPTPDSVSDAFWQACHGGQRVAAEYLLARGADINWMPSWAKETPLDIAASAGATELIDWLRNQGAKSAKRT
jgi:uncharacterized protein